MLVWQPSDGNAVVCGRSFRQFHDGLGVRLWPVGWGRQRPLRRSPVRRRLTWRTAATEKAGRQQRGACRRWPVKS